MLDFESGVNDAFLMDGMATTIGAYYLEAAGGGFGVIGTTDMCTSDIACPANNATNFYATTDDGYFFLAMDDESSFKLSSIDASFFGFNGQSYPAGVAGLLQITGFNAAGQVAQVMLNLAGPVNGSFNFNTYDLTAFGAGAAFDYVRFVSFACEVGSTTCNRTTNQAQFAVDNITTYVPEPGSFALMGLGLFGIGAIARRKAAAV